MRIIAAMLFSFFGSLTAVNAQTPHQNAALRLTADLLHIKVSCPMLNIDQRFIVLYLKSIGIDVNAEPFSSQLSKLAIAEVRKHAGATTTQICSRAVQLFGPAGSGVKNLVTFR